MNERKFRGPLNHVLQTRVACNRKGCSMERLTYYTYILYCYLPKGAWEEIRVSKTAEHVFVINYVRKVSSCYILVM